MTSKQFLLLALLVGLSGCKENKKEPVQVGADRLIDHVRLTDLENKPIDLEQYKGQTVFLNIWATWCKPCKEEMPSIARAQQILEDKKIVFILASGESLEEIQEFKAANNYPFHYTRLEESEGLSIPGLPTTFIFDNRGMLVFTETGMRKWDEKNNIDTLLKIVLPR